MTPYVRRVAVAFTAGGILGLLGILLPLEAIFGGNPLRGLLGPLAGFVLGGMLGGASLGLGTRPILSFGAGFLVPGFLAPVLMLDAIGRVGGDGLTGALLSASLSVVLAAVGFALAFGLAGGIGATTLRGGRPVVESAAAAFALGGMLGGGIGSALALLPIVVHAARPGPSGRWEFVTTIAGLAMGVILPYAVGGSRLASTVQRTIRAARE